MAELPHNSHLSCHFWQKRTKSRHRRRSILYCSSRQTQTVHRLIARHRNESIGHTIQHLQLPKNNDVRTSLIEGSLQIYFTGKENESIILSPNEQISIKNGTIKVDTISHHDYFLWKEGIYSFKDELLVDILNKLQLYYDVRIIIRNPSINQEKYTGKFRQRDSIDDILRMLQKIHKFKIQKDEENNIITLS